MVSKEHRFHGLGSLRFVYGRGKVVRGPMFLIKYAHNSHRTTYRVAVVVSKKVSKSAVVRNRIRRRIFEAIRSFEAQIVEPYDIAVTVHDVKLAEIPSSKLHDYIEKQLKSATII